ncbi:MAG: amidohydrolase family protein [Anaerolineales bacterium]|jgi:carbamoyl-phosphate synthase/aspartate carbamoyltransferase/dihydroorotase|nr:amidohydrolase family protein [Anaerolineales bacterium]
MIRLPGLIDPHVHLREPGATHKEDYDSGTASALAGGVTMVLAMPNTQPPIFDETSLRAVLATAKTKARCDYAQYLGAGPENAAEAARLAPQAAALKMYLDSTFGQLRLDDMSLWLEHFRLWPGKTPIVTHSESRSMAAAIWMAQLFDKPIHIAHISLREEILLIKEAKQRGIKVTCEVCPHHLFLTEGALPLAGAGCECCRDGLSGGRAEVRPRLATKADVEALWQNMEYIDCFATDHAPHTLPEKDSENPPPGFPGLETLLPLLLTAVSEGRLTLDQIIQKSVINPARIFDLPEQPETWVEVDENAKYEIRAAEQHSRCGWTPFEGWQVKGRVTRVVLRGQEAYQNGKILAEPGFGKNVRA